MTEREKWLIEQYNRNRPFKDHIKTMAEYNRAMLDLDPAGIGEHPNIVEECDKLVKQIASANEGLETLAALFSKPEGEQNG